MPLKAGTYAELKVRFFSTISPKKKKKSSTIKGLKSSSRVSSCLNQLLIVSNLKNQSLTDRQTDKRTGRLL